MKRNNKQVNQVIMPGEITRDVFASCVVLIIKPVRKVAPDQALHFQNILTIFFD